MVASWYIGCVLYSSRSFAKALTYFCRSFQTIIHAYSPLLVSFLSKTWALHRAYANVRIVLIPQSQDLESLFTYCFNSRGHYYSKWSRYIFWCYVGVCHDFLFIYLFFDDILFIISRPREEYIKTILSPNSWGGAIGSLSLTFLMVDFGRFICVYRTRYLCLPLSRRDLFHRRRNWTHRSIRWRLSLPYESNSSVFRHSLWCHFPCSYARRSSGFPWNSVLSEQYWRFDCCARISWSIASTEEVYEHGYFPFKMRGSSFRDIYIW